MKRFLLILLIGLSSLTLFSQSYPYEYRKVFDIYDWQHTWKNPKTLSAIGIGALSGVLWGVREINHAYPDLLGTYYNQSPYSFIGEQSWKRQYYGWDPNNQHKPDIFNSFRDIHHFSGFMYNVSIPIEHSLIWDQNIPRKYKYLNTVLVSLTRTFFAGLTYEYFYSKKQ